MTPFQTPSSGHCGSDRRGDWNRADLAVADQIFDAAYAAPEKAFVPVLRAAFPDSHHTVEELIAEGDKVVTRFTWRGTHRGEFMGVAPTGRSVTMSGIDVVRVAGGKISEFWYAEQTLELMQRLGAAPAFTAGRTEAGQ